MNTSSGSTTYYLDWFEVGKRNRNVSNHRILLYGNFFMHAARYAAMKACRCVADCICTNKPINDTKKELLRHLTAHSYSLVVLGEGVAWEKSANAEYVNELKLLFPYTTFVLATMPSTWMLPPHYSADETCRVCNNDRCKEISVQENIPCLDLDAWAGVMGLQTVGSEKNIKSRLAWRYLKQCRISKAAKAFREQSSPKTVMRMAQTLLSLKLGEEVRRLISKGIPTPPIEWFNKWQHENANALIIGDSNTRNIYRSNEYLGTSVDMFATSAPMIAPETYEIISEMLTPSISRVCFSIGAHNLSRWSGPYFKKQLRDFLLNLRGTNRSVLLLTVTEWADKRDFTKPDDLNNAIIHCLNEQMKEVAAELGIQVLDLQDIMKGNPFQDYIHYVKKAYEQPASIIAHWLQFGTLPH